MIKQTLEGITLAEASTIDFSSAVTFTVTTALEKSDIVISDLTVSVSSRRQLLENVKMMYTLTASTTDGETSSSIIDKLQESVNDGNFLTILKTSSGLAINSVAGSIAVDITPTEAPSLSPITPTESGIAFHSTLPINAIFHADHKRFIIVLFLVVP